MSCFETKAAKTFQVLIVLYGQESYVFKKGMYVCINVLQKFYKFCHWR